MHDPMVVVFDLTVPIPRTSPPWKSMPRWGFHRRRYSPTCEPNSYANRPMDHWWRPKAWVVNVRGRTVRWRTLATIWHVEPKGHDSGTICKGMGGSDLTPHNVWWVVKHLHHLHIQIPALQSTRARLFDRCMLCKRKGRPNVSHQWDGHGVGWRKWRSREGLYHMECSSLVHLREGAERDKATIRELWAWVALETGKTDAELLERLRTSDWPFMRRYNLEHLLGYERDDSYELVPRA